MERPSSLSRVLDWVKINRLDPSSHRRVLWELALRLKHAPQGTFSTHNNVTHSQSVRHWHWHRTGVGNLLAPTTGTGTGTCIGSGVRIAGCRLSNRLTNAPRAAMCDILSYPTLPSSTPDGLISCYREFSLRWDGVYLCSLINYQQKRNASMSQLS
jgi:hypothetical protein